MLTNIMWCSIVFPFYLAAILFLCLCMFAVTKEYIPSKKIKRLKCSFVTMVAICACLFFVQLVAKAYFFEKTIESIESEQSKIIINGRMCNSVCRNDLAESFRKRRMFKMKGSYPTSTTKIDIEDDSFNISLLLMADSRTDSLYWVYLNGRPSFVITYISAKSIDR